jgi:hypothetical protein
MSPTEYGVKPHPVSCPKRPPALLSRRRGTGDGAEVACIVAVAAAVASIWWLAGLGACVSSTAEVVVHSLFAVITKAKEMYKENTFILFSLIPRRIRQCRWWWSLGGR